MVLKVNTPHGEFTRTTATAYTHALVRKSPRAETAIGYKGAANVMRRWNKDRGYAVTWHKSEAAAQIEAGKPYGWDKTATVLGIYPVSN